MDQRADTDTTERRIVFYRADAGLDDDGYPRPVDLAQAIEHIDTLPFDENGRYLFGADDTITCCWVDERGNPARLRLATVRRSGLPQVEDLGDLLPLDIAERQGIADQTHVALFPRLVDGVPTTIAGAVFNFYGPRVPRLGYYLMMRASGLAPRVTFRPLLRRDTTALLEQLEDIRLFRLRVQPAFVQSVSAENQAIGTAFQLAREQGEAPDIEVVLRSRRRSRQPISGTLLDLARGLSRRDDLQEGALKFEVRGLNGETGRVDLVDVLSDKLVTRRRILRQSGRGRGLDDANAYAAIDDAYGELEDELLTAASVWAPE